MRKQLLSLIFLLTLSTYTLAQIGNRDPNVPDHTPMMNSTWEAIDKMMYKVTYEGSKRSIHRPIRRH